MKGWIKTTLGALVQDGSASYQTGPFGTALKASEYSPDGVPLISVGEIREGYLQIHSTTPRVNKVVLDRLPKYILRKDDIVFGRKGAIDRNAIINEYQDGWFLGSDGIRLRLSGDHNSLYFSYLLRSRSIGQWLMQNSQGAIMPTLNQSILDRLPVSIPDLKTQKKIAAVLSALDAKIALNQRINHELEGMAKLLYDYWFVQYDFPLSAAQAAALGKPRLAGQPYRTSGGKMVFNPTLKREIPVGWTCATLGELFNLYQPQTITDKDLKPDGDYFVYGANGIVGKYDRFNHEKPQIALTCRGSTCGNLTRTLPRSWITGNAMVMAPRDPNLDIEYIFNVANASGIGAIITGSGQPQITRTNLQGVKTISPDPDTLARYQGFAHPISKHRISLEQQNQELTALRDWLLPMLMNGQVLVG